MPFNMPIQLSTMPTQLSPQRSARPRTPFESNRLAVFAKNGIGSRIVRYSKNEVIFAQAATADALFYILEGTVTLRVVSNGGKEAIVAILGAGDFFGEGCLRGQALQTSTAVAMSDSAIVRLEKVTATRLIREEPAVSQLFLDHLLSRNSRMEEDLVDQLFNTSEKRLARLLLQLAKFHGEDKAEAVIPKVSQETLAEIVGTTRSRVSLFMNKFRRLGLVEYIYHTDTLKVRTKLLSAVLHDEPTPSSDMVCARPAFKTQEYFTAGQLSF